MAENKSVILYTIDCPKCQVLKTKLKEKGIEFIENNDIETMKALGIDLVPILSVDNELLSFTDAVRWIGAK